MRYLNLIVASSLMLVPTLSGCGGDDEGDGNAEAATETGTEGDGDGDQTGDGDGDQTGDGDGDGDAECIPADDSECSICGAENCCAEIQACEANEDCNCLVTCAGEGNNPQQCAMMCGANPMMVAELMALRACSLMFCMDVCGQP